MTPAGIFQEAIKSDRLLAEYPFVIDIMDDDTLRITLRDRTSIILQIVSLGSSITLNIFKSPYPLKQFFWTSSGYPHERKIDSIDVADLELLDKLRIIIMAYCEKTQKIYKNNGPSKRLL